MRSNDLLHHVHAMIRHIDTERTGIHFSSDLAALWSAEFWTLPSEKIELLISSHGRRTGVGG